MQMLNREFIQAFCRTLLHSLWEGMLFAIMAGLIILCTKKSSPATRYNILTSLFFLFILSVSLTFFYQLQDSDNTMISPETETFNISQQQDWGVKQISAHVSEKEPFAILINYFDQHASLVVAIWFILFSVQGIKLFANIGYTHRIRYYKIQTPPVYWQSKLIELARRLQIKEKITLIESGIIKVPALIGFLKPVILFPIGLLSQLSTAQVESVLLHELAHIKRRDYFVNLLQSFAEIIFFFNPPLLWISSLIREERENCCDDIAIGKTGDKKEFINALIAFQEYRLGNPKFAIAFPGRGNQLLHRISRIIQNKNKSLNNMEKISLLVCILIISCFTIASTQTNSVADGDKIKTAQVQFPKSRESFPGKGLSVDTIPEKVRTAAVTNITTMLEGKEYRFKKVNDSLVELYIDGERIPNEKMAAYIENIDRIMESLKFSRKMELDDKMIDMHKQELDLQQQQILKGKAEELYLDDKKQAQEINMIQLDKLKAEIDQMRLQLDKYQQDLAERQSGLSMEDGLQLLKSREQSLEMENQVMQKSRQELEAKQHKLSKDDLDQQNIAFDKRAAELQFQRLALKEEELKLNREIANSDTRLDFQGRVYSDLIKPFPPLKPLKDTKPIASIINDLREEKILDNKEEDLSFELNNKKLIVNGILQPMDIFLKLRARYLRHAKDHVSYSASKGSIHADVEVDDK